MTGKIGPCSPFFIVADVPKALDHYVANLGFECRFTSPNPNPFFAIVGRDAAQIMLKAIAGTVPPLPNPQRHEWAPWDAFIHTPNPDALALEFKDRHVLFRRPLGDTDGQLRGFEVEDPDGYVCFFGRPTTTSA